MGWEWLLCLSYLEESEYSKQICLFHNSFLLTNTFEIVKVVSVEGRNDLTDDNNEIAAVCPWL